jgi:hypothetical protein
MNLILQKLLVQTIYIQLSLDFGVMIWILITYQII